MKKGLFLISLVLALISCNGSPEGQTPAANLNWRPLYDAAEKGQDAFTLEAQGLEGATLELRYRPPGEDWGPWKRAGTFEGSKVQASLEWPQGVDRAGTEVQGRVVQGTRVLATSESHMIYRFAPIWKVEANSNAYRILAAGSDRVCTAGLVDNRIRVECRSAEDGALLWSFDDTGGLYSPRVRALAVAPDGTLYLGLSSAQNLLVFGPNGEGPTAHTIAQGIPTALAADEEYLYVGTAIRTKINDKGVCDGTKRYRYGLFVLDRENLTEVASHITNGADVWENLTWCEWNNSSIPALKAEAGVIYAAIAYRVSYRSGGDTPIFGCLGVARFHLEGKNLRQDWITRPDWDKACTQPDQTGTGDWLPGGAIAYVSDEDGCANGCRGYVYRLTYLDASSTYLKAAYTGLNEENAYVRKADGTKVSWNEASGGDPKGPAAKLNVHLNPGPDLLAFETAPPYDEAGRLEFARRDTPGYRAFFWPLSQSTNALQYVRDDEGRVFTLLCLETGCPRVLLARLR